MIIKTAMFNVNYITAIWDVTSCSFVDRYQRFGKTCSLNRTRREKQHVLPQRWYLLVRVKLHSAF